MKAQRARRLNDHGLTHASLCSLAVTWLKRANSAGGPNCTVAVSEVAGGWGGEIPDAIGFTLAHDGTASTVIEAKVSRSDFLADKKKPHRQAGGMGSWRYFMAPAGLIKPEELPEGWGLIDVTPGGICRVVAGAMKAARKLGYQELRDQQAAWRWEDCNRERETWLLITLLARVGDVEKANQDRRELFRMNKSLHEALEQERERSKALRRELALYQREERMKAPPRKRA